MFTVGIQSFQSFQSSERRSGESTRHKFETADASRGNAIHSCLARRRNNSLGIQRSTCADSSSLNLQVATHSLVCLARRRTGRELLEALLDRLNPESLTEQVQALQGLDETRQEIINAGV